MHAGSGRAVVARSGGHGGGVGGIDPSLAIRDEADLVGAAFDRLPGARRGLR